MVLADWHPFAAKGNFLLDGPMASSRVDFCRALEPDVGVLKVAKMG